MGVCFRQGGAPLEPRKSLARLMVQQKVHRAKDSVCATFIGAQTRFLKRKGNYVVEKGASIHKVRKNSGRNGVGGDTQGNHDPQFLSFQRVAYCKGSLLAL